ncbi:MAG: hypothetical protein GTN69_03425 [Armatimonadetes bacterium]|nr:hypothetical protein [Armatimonadota bacterium]
MAEGRVTDLLQRVRPYLRNGKRQLVQRPTGLQRVISYRTEVCIAWNMAGEAKEEWDVLDYLQHEHDWALATMEAAGISFDGPRRGQLGFTF